MKNLFFILLGLLIGFTQIIVVRSGGPMRVPVIFWVADGSTYRQGQYQAFLQWKKNQKMPPFELRLDPANNGVQKIILQSVTGVAGDIIQTYGGQGRYYAEIGILEDLGPILKEFGITTNHLSPAFKDLMVYDGKIIAYPANSHAGGVFCVNRNIWDHHHLGPLPERWDFNTFERLGRQFVTAANADKARLRKFFVNSLHFGVARNSLGVSLFNESLTSPAFNRPELADLIRRYRKWIVEDRILPSRADLDSFNGEGDNYGGASGHLHKGYFAMILIGRWNFSTVRQMKGVVNYHAAPHPDGGFQNHVIGGRTMGLYKGSHKKYLAKYFFKWLASDDYQKQIVGDADADPPDLRFLDSPEYLKPKGRSNEWAFNERLAQYTRETWVPQEFTPFAVVGSYEGPANKIFDAYLSSGIGTPESVLSEQEKVYKKAIQNYLQQHPEMNARFKAAQNTQIQIDKIRAQTGKVPLHLVANPFLKVLYERSGQGQ